MGLRLWIAFVLLFCLKSHAQQLDKMDVQRIEASLSIDPVKKLVSGDYRIEITVLQDTDTLYLNANKAEILEGSSNDAMISSSEDRIWMTAAFTAGQTIELSFKYQMKPSQTLYFMGDQIWSQGQGKYTSHWLPSLDDMNDKIEFDLRFSVPDPRKELDIISNGREVERIRENGQLTVGFDMENTMSSYLVALAIGPFKHKQFTSESGISNQLYYLPRDEDRFEPTYRWSKEIFDFLEEEIGFAYPWSNYKQVPVRDFLYAGMENTTATIFSEAFVTDSLGFTDRNYVNVNAHELAHQWFGNLVTEESGDHHWLHEGFASYYALQAERSIFGDEYYYWKLLQSAEQLQSLSDQGQGQSLLDASASSLTFYEKGAWALHQLRSLIGEEAFKKSIIQYLQDHRFANVKTSNFLDAVRANTLIDIGQWERTWLDQSAFPASEAYDVLKGQAVIQQYFEASALRVKPLDKKTDDLKRILSLPDDYSGQEAIFQLSEEVGPQVRELYRIGFESGNLMVRQAIALSLERIPNPLKDQYETLLDDPSYVTREAALYHLWFSFPTERDRFLDKMDGQFGFQNKSLRHLWLVLAIATTDYRPDKRNSFIGELRGYSSATYSYEIRQSALEYLNQLGAHNSQTLSDLLDACWHPNWRFRKASRDMLKASVANPKYKEILRELAIGLPDERRAYLEAELGK